MKIYALADGLLQGHTCTGGAGDALEPGGLPSFFCTGVVEELDERGLVGQEGEGEGLVADRCFSSSESWLRKWAALWRRGLGWEKPSGQPSRVSCEGLLKPSRVSWWGLSPSLGAGGWGSWWAAAINFWALARVLLGLAWTLDTTLM